MQLKKYRWSRAYESAEEELHDFLGSRKLEAEAWSAEEFQEFPAHTHDFDKKLFCAEGSIVFVVAGQSYSLQPGDALDLPHATEHSATAGISGCVCYEAHLDPA